MFLMRVPPASLNPLKDYVEKALAPADVRPYAVVTEVGFDQQASHPKLTFRVAQDDDDNHLFLDEEQYELVKQLRESEDTIRILYEEPEYAEAGTTGGDDGSAKAAEESPAPAPAPKKQKARPVDEEDVEVEQTAPAPKAAAAPPETDDEDEPEPAPPPPPKAKAAKPKAATKPSAPPDDDDDDAPPAPTPAAPAKAKGGFDDILDSLLG